MPGDKGIDMELDNRLWFRTKLATALVLLSAAALAFAVAAGMAPCRSVFAQSTSCNVGDTETFTGATTFKDEINVGATPGPGSAFSVIQSAGSGASPEWRIAGVIKAASETVNNSATLQDDDDLLFTVDPNAIYQVSGVITYSSGTTPDFKFGWTVPAGTIIDGVVTDSPDGAASNELKTFSESGSTVLNADAGDIATVIMFTVASGGTAGPVQFQWAQNTMTASDTILRAGSGWTVTRLN